MRRIGVGGVTFGARGFLPIAPVERVERATGRAEEGVLSPPSAAGREFLEDELFIMRRISIVQDALYEE